MRGCSLGADHIEGTLVQVQNQDVSLNQIATALNLSQSREAVGTPAFATHSVVHEEEAIRIVLVLHCE
jgi:predicted dithiol-disulfide oxidoreductase (DUF899 family)